MNTPKPPNVGRLAHGLALLLLSAATQLCAAPVLLQVDATDAPRNLLHARLEFPVQPGPLTLLYPKWIPGEHGPSGPITDLTGLKMGAGGRPINWRRDPGDMFAFHLEVPAGARTLEVALDFLLPPAGDGFSSGASSTPHLVDLSWNQILLYPKGARASDIQYAARLTLPPGWKSASALTVSKESPGNVEFAPVSLETLVDSPLIAGAHFRRVDLTPGVEPAHSLDIVGDSAASVAIKPELAAKFSRLVAETGALFGVRHYRNYHFLLTLSDHVAHFGLEHHESSDNRQGEQYLSDEDQLKLGAMLLPHEMVHSWNGKYRRPAGLATPDFEKPMQSELLWIYEGLTDYLGEVLATRCGLRTDADFREAIALTAAMLDHRAGRTWRPLVDTTVAAQLLYYARDDGAAWRRGVDFYDEGDLIWLEADVIIRQRTQGRASLNDFCRQFFGGQSGPPRVAPYTYADVVTALNQVATYDWKQFFDARVYAANPRAPLGGIEGSGWRLAYTNTVPAFLKSYEAVRKVTDLSYSLGIRVGEEGAINDVIPGSPADKAGMAAAMKLVAVNGRRWNADLLRGAIASAATNSAPIELLVEQSEFFKTCKVDYHDGEKYPLLERDASKPDLLALILKPRTSDQDKAGR